MAAFALRTGQTDWERVDRMTDLKRAIAVDPADPGNDLSDWETTARAWSRLADAVNFPAVASPEAR